MDDISLLSYSHSLELTTTVSVIIEAIMSTHTLPDLPYSYDALEPFISRQIMELHHKKHHQTYVNALIAAEASYAKSSTPRERIALQAALKFNGGGRSSYLLQALDASLAYRSSSIAISRHSLHILRSHQPLSVLEEPSACLQ